MFSSNDIHRVVAAAAPIALVCAAAIPQGIEKRSAPVPAAAANQDPVALWLESPELAGRPVLTTKGIDEATSPTTLGAIRDLVVDTRNFTVPFLVVGVIDGPRTAVPWHAARWDATARAFAVDATIGEMRSRAEIEPDHLDRLLETGAGTLDAGGNVEGEAAATPLPHLVLASRIAGHAVQARDGSALGKIQRVLVDPARGDIPAMVLAVDDHLHVVPGVLASLARADEKTVVVRFDRDADTLRGTPRLDREDVSLDDPLFRARVFRAVGLTPRPEAGADLDRR